MVALLLTLVLLTTTGAQAVDQSTAPAGFRSQNRERVPGAQPLRQLARLPDYARIRIPAGGRTKFYGETSIKSGGAPPALLRLHFYEWPLPKKPGVASGGRCALDIYSKVGARAQLRRVASFPAGTAALDKSYDFPVVLAEWMWLDRKHAAIPMLRFCCQAKEGFYGPVGENLFVTFGDGLIRPPALQSFANYSSHIDFVDWFFNATDARGYRQFVQHIDPLGEAPDTYVAWNWDAATQAFVINILDT